MSLKQIKVIECITSPFINSTKIKCGSTLNEQFFNLAGKSRQWEQLTQCPVLIMLRQLLFFGEEGIKVDM